MDLPVTARSEQNFPTWEEFSQALARPELNGSQGVNRAPKTDNQFRGDTDFEVIEEYLRLQYHNEESKRENRRQAERLLLWSMVMRGKPISGLDAHDLQDYFAFLDNPQPAQFWCGDASAVRATRWSPTWRPFSNKPLSAISKNNIVQAIRRLLTFLHEQGYLKVNVIKSINTAPHRLAADNAQAMAKPKAFTDEEMRLVETALERMPSITKDEIKKKARLQIILDLGIYLAARRQALSQVRWENIGPIPNHKNTLGIHIAQKGGRAKIIPLSERCLESIAQYRKTLGYKAPLPGPEETGPVIFNLNNKHASIGGHQVNEEIKCLLASAAKLTDDKELAESLLARSTHGLRGFAATKLFNAGVPLDGIQQLLGHSSKIITREHYIDDSGKEVVDKMQWRKSDQEQQEE